MQVFDFEDRPLRVYLYRGRPCWIAQDVGAALGYTQAGWRSALGNWTDELILPKDVQTLRGAELREFKSLCDARANMALAKTTNLTLLYESGVDLVCIKTEQPLGKKLRRFLADEIVPRLRRGSLDVSVAERELIALTLRLDPADASTIWDVDLVQHLCRVCRRPVWDGVERMPRWLRGPMGMIYRIVLGETVYRELRARNPDPRDGSLNYQFLTEARHKLMQRDMGKVLMCLESSTTSEQFFERLRHHYRRAPLQLSW